MRSDAELTSMLSKLLKRKALIRAPENPSTPDGTVIWAVGDIHGRLDLLRSLTSSILADAALSDARRKIVIFLGDYVDRGPDSKGVIQHLVGLSAEPGVEWRFLKGNHEETMLEFLERPSIGPKWCEYGGDAALASYGLKPPSLKHRMDAWRPVAADLEHRLSMQERAWLEALETRICLGDYCFVHAGLRPGVLMNNQSEADMLWIRSSFLDSEEPFEKVVVHGHTPTRLVHHDHRRIGIDTKAYATGVLTALRLEGLDQRLIQTCPERLNSLPCRPLAEA